MWSLTISRALLTTPVRAVPPPPRAGLATGALTSVSAVGHSMGVLALGGALAPSSDSGWLTDEQSVFMVVGLRDLASL